MKIAIAQINPRLGDFTYNSSKIIEACLKAKNADLLVFSELSLVGYPPYDLLDRPEIIFEQNKSLKKILKTIPKDLAIVLGGLHSEGSSLYNSAFFIFEGKIKKLIKKTLLPSYKVFYDKRHFTAGDLKNNFVHHKGKSLFITICEDIWGEQNKKAHPLNPLLKIRKKIDHFINLSASPYTKGQI